MTPSDAIAAIEFAVNRIEPVKKYLPEHHITALNRLAGELGELADEIIDEMYEYVNMPGPGDDHATIAMIRRALEET